MTIAKQKNDALLMLYPTETLDWLSPDAQIDAHLKHQKTPENGLFKPFSGVFLMAGAEGLEPSARGFGVAVESPKSA